MRLGLVHGSASLVTGNSALYATSSIASDFAYVRQVFDDNKVELDVVPFTKLVQQDPRWLRSIGATAQVVSQIGREILVVVPIPLRATTLTVKYVKHPTALVDGAGAWDLPDEHKPLVLDLVEAVLLFRGRQFTAMQEALQRAAPRLGLEDAAQIIRRGTVGEKSTAKPQSTAGTT
jgi:hypothetical protein